MNTSKHTELANHAWSVADLLRGDYKQSDYGKVILPFTVLRRMECVLAPTRDKVLETYASRSAVAELPRFLRKAAGQFNGSPLFSGAAESGESRIRQWIIENDWLEAIVALPDQLFYNTGPREVANRSTLRSGDVLMTEGGISTNSVVARYGAANFPVVFTRITSLPCVPTWNGLMMSIWHS